MLSCRFADADSDESVECNVCISLSCARTTAVSAATRSWSSGTVDDQNHAVIISRQTMSPIARLTG